MNRNAWRTPPKVFEYFNKKYNFKIDVCASAENALCANYITAEQNCLITDWRVAAGELKSDFYAWMNPPYDNIMPFVKRAAEQQQNGIGTVALVMADTSVGWYAEALKTCHEVIFVIGGRLSFLNPESGLAINGNNKGSIFLIWHPEDAGEQVIKHITRAELLR